ncbi:hypothetical protein N7461_007957 [Penicillium sp. DV-2018c]|nr:hypothetical protein N7461_007957 [Penicillium sp. DV-2018c]
MASTDQTHTEPETSGQNEPGEPQERASERAECTENGLNPPVQPTLALRYRKRAIYLLLIYVPLLVLPWIFTCLLAGPPAPNGASGKRFFPQYGLSAHGTLSLASWVAAVRTLNSIANVLTVPVISALLAQAAVVYTQKRKAEQKLTLRQMFALADRRWSDATVVVEAARTMGTGIGSRFLWLGMLLVVIGAIQHPIQQLLVSWQSVPVRTCLDDPINPCGASGTVVVGYDPEPADLATIHQSRVLQEVMNSLATFNVLDFETHLWPDPSYLANEHDVEADPTSRQTLAYWTDPRWMSDPDPNAPTKKPVNCFVTALQNNTMTGVLREHAIRLNSSAVCEQIPREQFPSACPGNRPFQTSFSSNLLDIRVCAPGEYGVYPWTLSRNRQDINEHLYLDVVDRRGEGLINVASFTLHCTTTTTRGYFELANYMNSQIYGPLLEEWPDNETMARYFDDDLNMWAGRGYGPPTEQDETQGYHDPSGSLWNAEPADPFGTGRLAMSGPLMTSAIALFGNQSWFEVAADSSNRTFPPAVQQICQQGRIPFSNLAYSIFESFRGVCSAIATDRSMWSDTDEALSVLLGDWVYSFNNTNTAEMALLTSMYLANRAMLTQTAAAMFEFSSRAIYFGRGMLMPLPVKTLAGTAVVSILIFLQLLGLAFVAWYIYRLPTWTPALDAVAIARIGIGLKDIIPELGNGDGVNQVKLKDVDGWIGLDEEQAKLKLGGSGVICRRHARQREKKRQGKKQVV